MDGFGFLSMLICSGKFSLPPKGPKASASVVFFDKKGAVSSIHAGCLVALSSTRGHEWVLWLQSEVSDELKNPCSIRPQ